MEILAALANSVRLLGVAAEALEADLRALPEVVGVHDLHVWTITSGMDAVSVHLVVAPGSDTHAPLDRPATGFGPATGSATRRSRSSPATTTGATGSSGEPGAAGRGTDPVRIADGSGRLGWV